MRASPEMAPLRRSDFRLEEECNRSGFIGLVGFGAKLDRLSQDEAAGPGKSICANLIFLLYRIAFLCVRLFAACFKLRPTQAYFCCAK